jgi:uncharacterized delta-60 repeat protein
MIKSGIGKLGLMIMFLIMGVFVFSSKMASADQWIKTYVSPDYDDARSIQQTSDGGYIVAGWTWSYAGSYDFWVLKLNSDGTVAWQKTYGGTDNDYAHSIQQTSDGGYIVAGDTYSFVAGSYDFWVLKLNSDGTVVWQKTYGGTDNDYAHSIQQTSDGGYIVAGYTWSFGAGSYDFWVLKLNSDGTVAWQKTYGGTEGDLARSIQQTTDGGYIVAGGTDSFGDGYYVFWVLKLNSDGTVAWQKTYGGTEGDEASSIQQTSDGGYIVAGQTFSFGAGAYDFWVLKLNSNGAVAWQKTYGGTDMDQASSIQQTSDGGYIVAGNTRSFRSGTGSGDVLVLKLNSNGTVAWQKIYGGPLYDFAYSIQQTSDGGYIVAGWTRSFGVGSDHIWVLKLDAHGEITECNAIGTSSATVNNTAATIINTTVSGSNTNASLQISTATVTDTNATVAEMCYYVSPTIGYSPTSFSFTAIQGGSNPPNQSLSIWNAGDGTLNWSVSDNATWLSLNPISGQDSGAVTVSVNIAGLIPDTYNATITITASGATNSPVSIPVTLTINPTPPDAPTNLKATSTSSNQIKLTWKDNSTNETSFKVYRKKGSGSWKLIATKGANVVSYTDSTATGNTTSTTCSYYVKACNNSGCSPATKWAVVPHKPTTLTATASSSSRINLSWTDKSNNETGFEIYRNKEGCSSTKSWSKIKTTGPNITSYINTGLTLRTTYSYKLRAYKKSSNTPYAYGYSLYTDCKSATTPIFPF